MNLLIINRSFAMGNIWTFEIKPIKKLVDRYMKNAKNVLIPFAGKYRFDRNGIDYIDIAEDMPKPYIKGDCVEIMQHLTKKYDLIIVDPPYTFYQAVRRYNNKKLQDITIVKNLVDKLLENDSIVIFLGYNSTGMSNKRKYKKIEILLVNLGGSHNDIIVTVEKKGNPQKNYFHGFEGLR